MDPVLSSPMPHPRSRPTTSTTTSGTATGPQAQTSTTQPTQQPLAPAQPPSLDYQQASKAVCSAEPNCQPPGSSSRSAPATTMPGTATSACNKAVTAPRQSMPRTEAVEAVGSARISCPTLLLLRFRISRTARRLWLRRWETG